MKIQNTFNILTPFSSDFILSRRFQTNQLKILTTPLLHANPLGTLVTPILIARDGLYFHTIIDMDCTQSGSTLWQLILKPSEFTAVLEASRHICREEEKQNALGHIPNTLTIELLLLPFTIKVLYSSNYSRSSNFKITPKLLKLHELLHHHSYIITFFLLSSLKQSNFDNDIVFENQLPI